MSGREKVIKDACAFLLQLLRYLLVVMRAAFDLLALGFDRLLELRETLGLVEQFALALLALQFRDVALEALHG